MRFNYATGKLLPKPKPKTTTTIYVASIALLLTTMCLEARAQAAAETSVAAAALGRDTLDIFKDTLQIEEVEVNAGYYTVTDRSRTGSIGRIDAKTVSRQPVGNVLASMHGQVTGVEVTQQTGIPGGNITLRIRGQNSLLNGSDPLYIIDGVPFLQGQSPLNRLTNPTNETTDNPRAAGFSPLSLLNPSDIASIEILKDADATAIYGSRGANGVVLITTKKGLGEQFSINAIYRTGLSNPTRTVGMLTGPQYLAMRREAFTNDGLMPDASNAQDLTGWDTSRYTNFNKLLYPRNAMYNDMQLSVTGGSLLSSYLISASYHDESTVFNRSVANRRFGLQSRGSVEDSHGKFKANTSLTINRSDNHLPVQDLTRYLNSSPYLRLYNEDGTLAWDNNGVPYRNLGMINANPLAHAERRYQATYWNFIGNLSLAYQFNEDFALQTNAGFNLTTNDEHSRSPTASLDHYSTVKPSANFANGKTVGWIVEPQLSYEKEMNLGVVSALIGATWQDQEQSSATTYGTNYSGDALLGSVTAAGNIVSSNSSVQYRYQGAYTRLNFTLNDRYIFNLTGRRDGSSRFGPASRYAFFWAAGAAWIFSSEQFIALSGILNFGKLRASYGVTGNDQIGDYRYLDLWSPTSYTYEGQPSLNPTALFNPNFSWERNRKLEFALETRFLNNNIRIDLNYFRNTSDNQLIQYTLPQQTGFGSVVQNLPATILNAGWEVSLGFNVGSGSIFGWSSSVNLTLPKNRLLTFPDLASSSYSKQFVVGRSLTTRLRYQYLGVDTETGIYRYQDVDENGVYNNADLVFPSSKDIYLFGGFNNSFYHRRFELTFTLDFKKQDGYNYLFSLGSNVPGYGYANQPTLVLRRWEQPGDQAPVQRFTATTGDAYFSASRLASSNAIISDASFVRLRSLAFSYTLPDRLTGRIGFSRCRLSIQGQNLFTMTNYEGADPENQNLYALSPLRTWAFSIDMTL
ncbi:SusC/RagA family TonB-linked outer membrane protein [Parapedobacter deserti]|uniref:SusC/RagA family TonB-linked outer membrane protein n=1 Tax=Parapedobacter deserti TaxID=1912957 RepID=A0ABV7JJV3_9SPHI